MNREELEPSAYGWELPEGWRLYAYEPGGEPAILEGRFDVGEGCVAWIEGHVHAPFNGPTRVTITAESTESANQSDGVTVDMLRSVPLGEARRVLTEWIHRIRTELDPGSALTSLPDRVESTEDYAKVAQEYVRLLSSGERRPIEVMAEAWGVSRNTASARVRRARNRGLLMQVGSTTGHLRAELTEAALQALRGEE